MKVTHIWKKRGDPPPHIHWLNTFTELAKTFFFCLTLGQTGTGVLSDPWPLCLSHHFFCNIVYNLSDFAYYTELNERLPIIMIIKQLLDARVINFVQQTLTSSVTHETIETIEKDSQP